MDQTKRTGGRTKKNSDSRRITFTPSQKALEVYLSWPQSKKSETLDNAILQFKS